MSCPLCVQIAMNVAMRGRKRPEEFRGGEALGLSTAAEPLCLYTTSVTAACIWCVAPAMLHVLAMTAQLEPIRTPSSRLVTAACCWGQRCCDPSTCPGYLLPDLPPDMATLQATGVATGVATGATAATAAAMTVAAMTGVVTGAMTGVVTAAAMAGTGAMTVVAMTAAATIVAATIGVAMTGVVTGATAATTAVTVTMAGTGATAGTGTTGVLAGRMHASAPCLQLILQVRTLTCWCDAASCCLQQVASKLACCCQCWPTQAQRMGCHVRLCCVSR